MRPIELVVSNTLEKYLSTIVSKSILYMAISKARINADKIKQADQPKLFRELELGINLYLQNEDKKQKCLTDLKLVLNNNANESISPDTDEYLEVIPILKEIDIVVARTAGRKLCEKLGFSLSAQVKVSTAISELSRNIIQYAGRGEIVLEVFTTGNKKGVEVRAIDDGPGISNLESILSGHYRSKTGMGKGITGTKNLVDEFDIKTAINSGTEITLRKWVS